MPSPNSLQSLSLGQFAERFSGEMIPLGNRFSYFCAAVTLTEEDLKEYLEEPVAALPPVIASGLPKIQILLVPYLQRKLSDEPGPRRRLSGEVVVATEKPSRGLAPMAGTVFKNGDAVLAFAVKDQEVADYHYQFYRAIAEIVAEQRQDDVFTAYLPLIREELSGNVHGEVDEASWRLKQGLHRRGGRRESKAFREYCRQSFIDTLTLYLHGLCCDIDVETGPRQLPSRHLRRRLQMLRQTYPPPSGYPLFPEESNT